MCNNNLYVQKTPTFYDTASKCKDSTGVSAAKMQQCTAKVSALLLNLNYQREISTEFLHTTSLLVLEQIFITSSVKKHLSCNDTNKLEALCIGLFRAHIIAWPCTLKSSGWRSREWHSRKPTGQRRSERTSSYPSCTCKTTRG